MKIGCLQFAPQVGDVGNNLIRANSILSKSQDLEDLDLLVLPELAFTGYNFHSLAHITPFLELSESGTSSLWAQTTALKFNCNVVVGYPEQVDVTDNWPASPEFYNSAILVSRDGEIIGNYRNCFLYAADETWALEGQDGFFECHLPDLGNVAMGICMDINPYKFEAPWDDFEFAFHILEVQANVVIVTMAWLTREDPRVFTQLPQEPDMETLGYWIRRLEPVIHRENDEETIAVFCNRTGIEGNCAYAGTSAVFGIKNGEVNLYGVLGRGVKELLVVDTEAKPLAKVVQADGTKNDAVGTKNKGTAAAQPQVQESEAASHPASSSSRAAMQYSATSPDATKSHRDSISHERCEEWDGMSNAASAGSTPSVTSDQFHPSAEASLLKPELQIPTSSRLSTTVDDWRRCTNAAMSPARNLEDMPTPTATNPNDLSFRPAFGPDERALLPEREGPDSVDMVGGRNAFRSRSTDVTITQPFKVLSTETEKATASLVEAPPALCFSGNVDWESSMAQMHYDTNGRQNASYEPNVQKFNRGQKSAIDVCMATPYDFSWKQAQNAPFDMSGEDDVEILTDDEDDDNFEPFNTAEDDMLGDMKQELSTIFAKNHDLPSTAAAPQRPQSTKSRNASRRRIHDIYSGADFTRSISQSQLPQPSTTSPTAFAQQSQSTMRSSELPLYFRADSNSGSRPQASGSRQTSDAVYGQQQRARSTKLRSDSPMVHSAMSLPFSRDRNRVNTAPIDAGMSLMKPSQPATRAVSRGRQPFSKMHPTNGDVGSSSTSVEPGGFSRHRRPSVDQNLEPREWSVGDDPTAMTDRASSVASSVSWLFGSPPPRSASRPATDPDDEIVAMINRIDNACPVHRHGSRPAGSVTLSRNQNRQHQTQDELPPQPASSTPDRHQTLQPRNMPTDADSVYEIILPPHIRELVESLSSDRNDGSPLRALEAIRGHTIQKFNPPTPTAMLFTNNEYEEAPNSPVVPLKAT